MSTRQTIAAACAFFAVSCAVHAQSPNAAAPSPSQAPAPAAQPRNDYSKPDTWLCRPGRQDACSVDLSTTIVSSDGKLAREEFKPNPNPPIDCFYVYPTVSTDATPNSDMTADPAELNVIHHQFARFASVCRTYAPLYRQITLTALRGMIAGQPLKADVALGFNDVVDAWNHYLKHDNQGRGVVLIGHSQGSRMLDQLLAREIEGKPVHSQIISALLIGSNITVPKGKEVGGSFKQTPVCRSETQTGCVIAYVTFRENVPPPANSRFGKTMGDTMQVACTNPAALGGGPAELHAYLGARRSIVSSSGDPKPWTTPEQKIDTPFVSAPGLLTGECVVNEHGSYLSVKVNADPNDPRTDDIAGDVINNGQVMKDWGLHLIDVNIAMGDLVDVVGKQAKAYTAKK